MVECGCILYTKKIIGEQFKNEKFWLKKFQILWNVTIIKMCYKLNNSPLYSAKKKWIGYLNMHTPVPLKHSQFCLCWQCNLLIFLLQPKDRKNWKGKFAQNLALKDYNKKRFELNWDPSKIFLLIISILDIFNINNKNLA